MDVAMGSVVKTLLVASAAFFCATLSLSSAAAQSWYVEQLIIPSSLGAAAKRAVLYMPRAAHRVSAIVMIINKSEAANWVRDYYAPNLASGGVAVLTLHEFKPLDLRNVLESTELKQLE